MASLKAQMSMLRRILTNIGTGKLGTKGKWNTPEKREAGIIQATTTWENHVKANGRNGRSGHPDSGEN